MVNNNIKGTTSVFGVIGDPICHSFSPTIHNTMAAMLGKDIAYMPFRVEENNIEKAIKGAYALNIKGLNVTVPHKIKVMKYLCDIDKNAKIIGAVNTLKYTDKGYVGYNTDVIGVYYAIKNAGFEIKGKTVILIGAGGAANACGVMAADKGADKIYIANRTVDKAENLAERIRNNYSCSAEALSLSNIDSIENADIIINATTVGFGGNVGISPIEDTGFYKAKNIDLVFDAVYAPWKTKLLEDAQKAGCHIINGFSMLVYQAVAAEEIWFEESYDESLKEKLCLELSKFYKENC